MRRSGRGPFARMFGTTQREWALEWTRVPSRRRPPRLPPRPHTLASARTFLERELQRAHVRERCESELAVYSCLRNSDQFVATPLRARCIVSRAT